MANNAPGKHYRDGLSLVDIFRMFPDDAAAEKWITQTRWPNGIACVRCGSTNVQTKTTHPRMPFRCRDCRKFFSPKTGTPMQSSNLGYQAWAIAIYLMTTGIKGTASMKLHRDLNSLAEVRLAPGDADSRVVGAPAAPVRRTGRGRRVATSVVKEKNKHRNKKLHAGRGAVGKTAVVAVKDRKSGKVAASVTPSTDGPTLRGFVAQMSVEGAKVYSDEAAAYKELPNHESVNHGVGKYVAGMAHTNGLESFWSLDEARLSRHVPQDEPVAPGPLRRASSKGRHNDRDSDTKVQMQRMVRGMEGKRLRYKDLIADSPNPRRERRRKAA